MSTSVRLVLLQFVLFGVLGLVVLLTPMEPVPPVARVIGLGLMVIGLAVVLAAILTHQTVNRKTPNIVPDPDQQVGMVTTGLYARMRHPIYGGILFAAFGVGLVHGGMYTWAVVAAMYIFFYAKSRYEEALLLHAYPEYKAYMMRTGRLLPRF